jgi:hypothetical protein
MMTGYRMLIPNTLTMTKLRYADVFDGRLEQRGIRRVETPLAPWCLCDPIGIIRAEEDWPHDSDEEFSWGVETVGTPQNLRESISAVFGVRIVAPNEPEFFGFATREEFRTWRHSEEGERAAFEAWAMGLRGPLGGPPF